MICYIRLLSLWLVIFTGTSGQPLDRMSLTQIKQAARRLSLEQLRRLDGWLHELIRAAEESARSERPHSGKQVVEERSVGGETYRLEGVRCGKEKCKCARGKLHGPYWYGYTRVKDKVKSRYVGKQLPREVERALNNDRKTKY
jgi:hypothetical protein